jgi:ketosteroid isomerase-like protein
MRLPITPTLLTILCLLPLTARDEEVLQVVARFQESLFKYDAAAADPILARDFVWVSQGGMINSRNEWLQTLKTGRIGNEFKNAPPTLHLHGDAAVVTFTQTPAAAPSQPAVYVRTLVLKREAQTGWKVILYQSTPIKNQ